MQCFQCGSEQAGGNAFCTKCGARLAGPVVPDRRPSDAPDKVPVSTSAKEEEETILRELKEALKGVDSDKSSSNDQTDRSTRSASKRFVIVGVAAVLMLAAIIGFELVRRKEGAPAPQPAPIETVLRPPELPPATSEATRSTVGKIAAILEAVE